MAMTMVTAVFFLLSVSWSLIIAETEAEAAPPSTAGCTDELLLLSACLPYVSSPPNNLTDTASAKCCSAFSSAADSLCFCYLVRDPNLLAFPLNTTRLLSLSSLCPPTSPTPTPTPTLNFLCSASPALPPLNSAGITSPHITAAGGGGGRGSGSSSGRTVPIITGWGAGTASHSHFPIMNGPVAVAPSTQTTHFWNTYTLLLLSQILTILVTVTLLNTTV